MTAKQIENRYRRMTTRLHNRAMRNGYAIKAARRIGRYKLIAYGETRAAKNGTVAELLAWL